MSFSVFRSRRNGKGGDEIGVRSDEGQIVGTRTQWELLHGIVQAPLSTVARRRGISRSTANMSLRDMFERNGLTAEPQMSQPDSLRAHAGRIGAFTPEGEYHPDLQKELER